MSNSKIRWGIMGCAKIAKNSVIPAIQQSELGEVSAIASRDKIKAQKTADELNIPIAYGSYEELLADPKIDAVYIPLPNHLHKDWTIKAAHAGKHVLCEKPIALNAIEAKEMVDECEKAGVHLAEAFMYRHHPRYDQIKKIMNSGEIGAIRAIHSTFTFNNAKDIGNVRYDAAMGGGSLYDVGAYPISVARYLLEREPEAATAHAFFSPEHDHVDMMVSGLLEFPDSVALTFDCGMWAAFRNTLQVIGADGLINVPFAFLYKENSAGFTVISKGTTREVTVPVLNQYCIQVDDFARSILKGKPLRFAPENAINNMKVIDACLKSAKERIRVVIN